MPAISHQRARTVYDRIGSHQDSQAFYEDAATTRLVELGELSTARSVFELGCGTGRFARRLLDEVLPQSARYRGVDLAPVMVELARARLEPNAPRAEVTLVEGPPPDEPPGSYDRFVSNYVFDLLSERDIRAQIDAAHRLLEPGGLLCVASLGAGVGPLSRLVAGAVRGVHAVWPSLLGGCRPVEIAPYLEPRRWRILADERIVSFGVPSAVVVARRLGADDETRPASTP